MGGTTERADGAAGTAPPRSVWLAAGAALFAVALVAGAASSSRGTLLALAGLAGLAGLGAIVRFAPERACDSLFLVFVGLVAIPVDAYLGYRAHTGGWPGLRVSVSDVCLYLLVVVAALGALLGRVENPIPARVLAWMGLLLLQYVLSACIAADRTLSLFEIASTLHAFLIAWIVATLFRRDLLGWVLALVALQVIVHSSLAVAQGVTGRPIGATWLGGSARLLKESLEGGDTLFRPAGLFAHPIIYATYLVLTLPLITAAAVIARGRGVRLLHLVALALGSVALVLTLSRGAWISTLVSFALLGVLALRCRLVGVPQIRATVLGVLLLCLAGGATFGPRIYERITRSAAGNLNVRFDLNRIALRMTLDNPVFGAGLNNFVETMAPYDPKDVKSYFPAPAHNLYLLEAAEAGVPALLLLLGLYGSILAMGLHHLPRMDDPQLQWIVAALLSGFVGLLLSQLADFSSRLEPLRSMIWLEAGLLFGVLHANRTRRLAGRRPASP